MDEQDKIERKRRWKRNIALFGGGALGIMSLIYLIKEGNESSSNVVVRMLPTEGDIPGDVLDIAEAKALQEFDRRVASGELNLRHVDAKDYYVDLVESFIPKHYFKDPS